ncbi:MAG: ROK family protein [Bacteroidota bacterium]
MGPLWGIDLGGTKIEGVVLMDRETPDVLKRLRIPTEAHMGYEHIIEQISRLVEVLTAETGIKPDIIGIGTPGTLDPATRLMKNCNTTCLNDRPLKRDLELALGIPIRLANDANCFAVAETNLGVVQDEMPHAEVVFGVIMGTGVGGGLVVNGKVIHGRHGIAGEWGHNYLDVSPSDCYCGKNGCVESIISGPSLEAYYEELMGKHLSLPEIIHAHRQGGDVVANKTIARLIHYFGKSMANVINIIDPDAIVLGGGLSNIDLLYEEGRKEVEKYVFNNEKLETRFLRPKLGDSAGVFGAALL